MVPHPCSKKKSYGEKNACRDATQVRYNKSNSPLLKLGILSLLSSRSFTFSQLGTSRLGLGTEKEKRRRCKQAKKKCIAEKKRKNNAAIIAREVVQVEFFRRTCLRKNVLENKSKQIENAAAGNPACVIYLLVARTGNGAKKKKKKKGLNTVPKFQPGLSVGFPLGRQGSKCE